MDQSVNTLTTERALLALVALWHRLPFTTGVWSWRSAVSSLFGLQTNDPNSTDVIKGQVDSFYEMLGNGLHSGVFEGCSLSDIIIRADNSFDWTSLPAEAG